LFFRKACSRLFTRTLLLVPPFGDPARIYAQLGAGFFY
jgi:hypothetical protein